MMMTDHAIALHSLDRAISIALIRSIGNAPLMRDLETLLLDAVARIKCASHDEAGAEAYREEMRGRVP